jgi:phosphatidylethanolamine/phosphatidyl-N-methylethanolamine N-methyltransferase
MRDRLGRSSDTLSAATLDSDLIEHFYAQCASVYDLLFGPILQAGRREAIRQFAPQPGNEILEIGIGTGLTVPLYPDDCCITGIDSSEPMLREAARNVDGRRNIQLFRMDAARLAFPDQSFDVVFAAYVISVVPDPLAVLKEMRRVCRVGGRIVLLNHFLSDSSFLSKVERMLSPITTARLGFRTDVDARLLLERAALRPIAIRKVNTPKIWTLISCERDH